MTGTGGRGRPVRGSIGVRLLPLSLVTHSVRRSHDGRHVLRQGADREVVDDLGRPLVDDVDRVGLRVGHVDARGVAANLRRQQARASGGVDVDGGFAAARDGALGGARRAPALAVHAPRGRRGRPRRAAGRRRRWPARSDSADGSRPARADTAGRGIDGPDAAALAGGGVAAAAEDVEDVAERSAGGMRQAGREVADDPRAMVHRVDAEDLVARAGAVGAAGDEHAPADRGGRRVAQRVGERRDLARRAARAGRRAPSAAAWSSCSRR